MWVDVFPLWPLMALATLGLGAPVRLLLLPRRTATATEVLAWDHLLGSGVAGYVLMAAGYLRLLHPALGWSLIAVGSALGAREIRAVLALRVRRRPRIGRGVTLALWLLTGLALLWQAWGCLTPEFGGDALNYHLGAPRDWIDAGRVTDSPLRFHPAMAVHHLMIYTWCLLVGGDVLCKLVQTTQFLAAALLIGALGRRLAGRRAGALAACFAVFSIGAAWYRAPVFARSDLTALLFSAGMLWAGVRLVRAPHPRWALVAGVATGLAVATKYSTLPFAVLPGAVALAVGLITRPGRLMMSLGVTGAVAVLVLSPWLTRGWLVTGDPLYPLLSDHLRIAPDYEEGRRQMADYQAAYRISHEPYLSCDRWRLWMRRLRDAATEGDFLIPGLHLLAPVALLTRSRVLRSLGAFGLSAVAAFALISLAEIGRLFLITAPASASLLAWAFTTGAQRTRLGGVLCLLAGLTAAWVLVQHQVIWSRMPHIRWGGQPVMTRAAAEAFIRKRTPHFIHVIPAYQWMDTHLPRGARVLCINHPYAYHLPRPHWTRDRWNMEVYDWLLARLGSTEAVTAQLQAQGITHVLRQGEHFAVDPSYWTWERTECRTVWQSGDVWVLALRPQGADANVPATASSGSP